MGKKIAITEKPSVAAEFAKALNVNVPRQDGYYENSEWIITWALGHLVEMPYPEAYGEQYKAWSLDTLPFLPEEYLYEVADKTKKQFGIIKKLFNRPDVTVIYDCGDSGREGSYIQDLIRKKAGCKKPIKRVWIDSQTNEEILRGIREAKDISEYKNHISAAYMRGKEDYAIGMNYSRLLTLLFGKKLYSLSNKNNTTIAVGRVMTCVLGMVVDRERAIRDFKKETYYKVGAEVYGSELMWKALEGSRYFNSPLLRDEMGFKARKDAEAFLSALNRGGSRLLIEKLTVKEEKKSAPLLFNLAELQNSCSKALKLSPSETLAIAQKLYEGKLTTYPRTDARVLSTAIAKEIGKNLTGLSRGLYRAGMAKGILDSGTYKKIANTRYTDDKKITDHYAIIPTGLTGGIEKLSGMEKAVYEMIVDRFLAIFLPPAVYKKYEAIALHEATGEHFYGSDKSVVSRGYLELYPKIDADAVSSLARLKQGNTYDAIFSIKEAETAPPKRYTSGSLILAMENAGNLIEDEELREQIKGSGIGTSATRADTIKKLVDKGYIALNKKTQAITPTDMGEAIRDIVAESIPSLLKPETTASWERGLAKIESGEVESSKYQQMLNDSIRKTVERLKASAPVPAAIPPPGGSTTYEKTQVGLCPLCGKKVYTSTKSGGWYCEASGREKKCCFGVPPTVLAAMTDGNKEALLKTGNAGLIKGIRRTPPKTGTYDAIFGYDKGKNAMAFLDPESDISCPKCKKPLKRLAYSLKCDKCGYMVAHTFGDKALSNEEIKELMTGGRTKNMVKGLKSFRTGNTYDAVLVLDKDGKVHPDFAAQGQ